MRKQNDADQLCFGPIEWNKWRQENPEIKPNLRRSYFRSSVSTGKNAEGVFIKEFSIWAITTDDQIVGPPYTRKADPSIGIYHKNDEGADLFEINFDDADLREVEFLYSDFRKASLRNTNLRMANLYSADLSGATLEKSDLTKTDLRYANFTDAKITECILDYSIVVGANFHNCTLKDCSIHGISAWKLKGIPSVQENLRISSKDDPIITVDNLEIAQFIYLLLNNEKIHEMLDETTSKVVLILGRFTPECKKVLDAIREDLQSYNYIPVLFDFQKPDNRDIIETVTTLAGMACFVIVDITDAKTVIQELENIVSNLPSVPVQPILLKSSGKIWAGYSHLKRKSPNLLEIFYYEDLDHLRKNLTKNVIEPAGSLRTKLMQL
jgi:hypothetical protein